MVVKKLLVIFQMLFAAVCLAAPGSIAAEESAKDAEQVVRLSTAQADLIGLETAIAKKGELAVDLSAQWRGYRRPGSHASGLAKGRWGRGRGQKKPRR